MINLPRTVDGKPDWQRDSKSPIIKDLLIEDYSSPTYGMGLLGIDLILVTGDMAMRSDLITQKMYGYLDPLEKVLKFNNISNPFAINEGDVLTIWDLQSINSHIRPLSGNSKEREDIRNQYVTPEKKSTIDPRLQDFDKRSQPTKPDPSKGKNAPALPPNLADFGDQEITLVNGKLVLGGAVSASGLDSQEPISKSDFVAKMIKQRLKNT